MKTKEKASNRIEDHSFERKKQINNLKIKSKTNWNSYHQRHTNHMHIQKHKRTASVQHVKSICPMFSCQLDNFDFPFSIHSCYIILEGEFCYIDVIADTTAADTFNITIAFWVNVLYLYIPVAYIYMNIFGRWHPPFRTIPIST